MRKIQFVPGVGNIDATKITLNGCFHDMPWGLQTQIYAPFDVDLRYKYQVAGNQPGIEPPQSLEIGLESLGAPEDGLYLREDIEFKCNIAMAGFVKSQAKAANKQMVERIVKKAGLLDAGILQAMMQSQRALNKSCSSRLKLSAWKSSAHTSQYQLPTSPESPTQQTPHMFQAPSQHGPDAGKQSGALAELPGDSQHYQYYHDYRRSASSSDLRWSQNQLGPSLAETQRLSISGGSMPHINGHRIGISYSFGSES
ncbi:hypothetical protein E4U55_006808 [Claviceps digitariae]|nr:hypothetical protein E4U55_006808 [Claviceps digitariae]